MMKKFKFLCANHSLWLSENPKAAADNWLQSYSRSLDFVQECNNRQAINHAGAAFETAKIHMGVHHSVQAGQIH